MSRVISSYIPSFKALAYARETEPNEAAGTKMLQVTMPTSPGHPRKLDISYETNAIGKIFGKSVIVLEYATPADALKQLPPHTFAHFACHGFSLSHDPSRSGLLLVEKNGERAILTIEDLTKTDLKRAKVAYLSACSTAETSSERLLDEAINLANAFQTSGFQHVVGTLWDTDDYAAGKVAEGFYARLFGDDNTELSVAKALYESVMDYKEGNEGKSIRKWGSFIYIGM